MSRKLCIVASLCAASILEQYGKENAGQWGWIDKSGSFVIQPQFEESVGLFSDGLATVVKNGKYGYINKKGKWMIPPQFLGSWGFKNGLAPVLVNREPHELNN